MSDETTLETIQDSLVILTSETMKSNLTEAIEKLEKLETESNLSNSNVTHVYNDLMKKIEHLKNLIAALETINRFIRDKDGIHRVFTTIPKK